MVFQLMVGTRFSSFSRPSNLWESQIIVKVGDQSSRKSFPRLTTLLGVADLLKTALGSFMADLEGVPWPMKPHSTGSIPVAGLSAP
jgi:hypothetical protein